MTSASSMLERELLNLAPSIIDAHSNASLTQPLQQNTYRTSYGISSQLPYTTTSSSYQPFVYNNTTPTESYESKKTIADVKRKESSFVKSKYMFLVARSNSYIKKRIGKKRCTCTRINII